MKLSRFLFATGFILWTAVVSHADLGSYLWELNASARGDAAAYQRQIQQRFGVSTDEFDTIRRVVDTPAEVAVVLWLSERCGLPVDAVLRNKNAVADGDWEQVAVELGLTPASSEFAALHYGELGWSPVGAARYGSLVEYTEFQARQN